MDIQTLKIAEIKPAAYNPRKDLQPGDLEYEKLLKSIKEFDMVEPLVYNSRTGNLVGGHQRLKVMKDLGYTEVEVSVVDLDLTKEKALNLALNKIAGEWDTEKLKDILEELDTGAFDIEVTGFDLNEIADLMGQVHGGGNTQDDAVPDVTESICAMGDLWELGPHRVFCGDILLRKNIDKLMAGEKAAMVFTDPPYNVNYGSSMRDSLRHKVSKENASKKIANDNFETEEEFFQFLKHSLAQLKPHVIGDVYCCMSSSELAPLQRAFGEVGGHFSTFIIWVKNTFTMGRANYQRQYEPILYGWFEGSSHYWSGIRRLGDVIRTEDAFVNETGEVFLKADNLSMDIWEFPKPQKNKEHPTMKPVALCARGIGNSSRVGDIVLDTFAGSGSTLIACDKLGRRGYMMELIPHYCDVIIKRWEEYSGQTAVRLSDD